MRRLLLTLVWLVIDGAVFASAYALAYFLKVGFIFSSDLPFETYLSAVLMTVPGWLFVMVTMRNYALSRRQRSLRNFLYIGYACSIGMAGFTLAFYFLKASLFSRLLLLIAGVLSTFIIFLWHAIFDQIARRILRMGKPTYRLLLIGATREAERLIQKLQRTHSPFVPIAVLDGRGTTVRELGGVPILGKLDKLERTIREREITHLVQCSDLEQSINLVSACTQLHITYFILPSVLGIAQQHERVEALEGEQVVTVDEAPLWQWFFR